LILLLVDDDRISIDILAEYIKPHFKRIDEVLCAYDGQEAYDVILSVKPNIIVTDIKMPNMSGITLITKIRSIEHYSPKVIIISSYSDFEYAREALKLNVYDYIVKPVDQDELINKINLCIEPNKNERALDHEDIFDKVQKFLSENLSISLKLLDISNHFHYNSAYLGRLIKEKTGLYFNDYILKLRVIKAQSLLTHTNHLIHKISGDLGFKDPEYFTKKFKKFTGMTPSEYRNQNKIIK
jgi:two-component system, response regulator YesN